MQRLNNSKLRVVDVWSPIRTFQRDTSGLPVISPKWAIRAAQCRVARPARVMISDGSAWYYWFLPRTGLATRHESCCRMPGSPARQTGLMA
jgi:hypothetical protein